MPSNTSPAIDSQLKEALGNKKPAEVRSEILEKLGQFYLDNPGALEAEARQYDEDDPNLVIQVLEKSRPGERTPTVPRNQPGLGPAEPRQAEPGPASEGSAPNLL
jgi:hypothetical protein